MTDHDDGQERKIRYFVNGEAQESLSEELTVGQILEKAGFTPGSMYDLVDDKSSIKYSDAAQEVSLKNGEHFTATYKGPTPTS